MTNNQISWKPVAASSIVGGVAAGALEYATYNKRLFNSGCLTENQFAKIAESLVEKFPDQEVKILGLKDNPKECYNHIFDMYKNCCDDAGRLIHDSKKISKEYFDVIKGSLNKLRVQQSIIFGGLFALGCAAFSLITNKISAKKAVQANKNS